MISVSGFDETMIANNLRAAEVFHPGELLKDELEYRGISQKAFAAEIGIPASVLNDVLNGKRQISTEYAMLIEAALGIEASMWLKMQADFNMRRAENNPDFMARLRRIRKQTP